MRNFDYAVAGKVADAFAADGTDVMAHRGGVSLMTAERAGAFTARSDGWGRMRSLDVFRVPGPESPPA